MTRAAIEKEICKYLEVIPVELVRQIGQPNDFDPMMPDKISKRDFKEMVDGLETIQRIIGERLYLRTNVDFKAIMDEIVQDYRDWINGEKECFADNKIIKAPKFLLTLGTIHGTIPMLIDELSKGIVRPEFRFKKSKGKFISWEKFKVEAEQIGVSERKIRDWIESGDIPNAMIEYGRTRGPGKEIDCISREALQKINKLKSET